MKPFPNPEKKQLTGSFRTILEQLLANPESQYLADDIGNIEADYIFDCVYDLLYTVNKVNSEKKVQRICGLINSGQNSEYQYLFRVYAGIDYSEIEDFIRDFIDYFVTLDECERMDLIVKIAHKISITKASLKEAEVEVESLVREEVKNLQRKFKSTLTFSQRNLENELLGLNESLSKPEKFSPQQIGGIIDAVRTIIRNSIIGEEERTQIEIEQLASKYARVLVAKSFH